MATTAHVVRASTSAGLSHAKTGERFLSSGGMHVFVHVADGTDAKRFIDTLHERCWLHGFGYYVLGKAGQLLDRSIMDCAVSGPERLVFEGSPILEPPLQQDKAARMAVAHEGAALDTYEACPPLSDADEQS